MSQPGERRALTVEELVRVLEEVMARDPSVRRKLVLTTSEAGYVHEHVSGIDRIEGDYLTLGEP